MKKNIKIKEVVSVDVKRFELPVGLKSKCKECGSEIDFLENYLSYPCFNIIETVYACCSLCETEHSLNIKLGLSIKFDTSDIEIL